MANKPEDTNDADANRDAILPSNTTRLQLSRYEREQRTRRIVVIGAAVVGLLTVLLIGLALLQSLVIEPNRTIASVAGQPISASQVQKRIRYQQGQINNQYGQLAQQVQQLQQQGGGDQGNFLLQFYGQQLQQLGFQTSPEAIGKSAVDDLINDKLVRLEATKRGIAVSADEVNKEIEKSFGFFKETLTPFPTDTAEPTATNTALPTNTPLPTATNTNTPAPTATNTNTPAPTLTIAPTISGSVASTSTVATATLAPSATATKAAATATSAPTNTVSPTLAPAATLTPTVALPTPTKAPRLQPTSIAQTDYDFKYNSSKESFAQIGYTAADLSALVESNLIETKLREALGKEVKTDAPHYQFSYVRYNSIEAAQKGDAEIKATSNVSFGAFISQTNSISPSVGFGTSVGEWTSASGVETQFSKDVVAQLETAPLNKPTGVISTSNGIYILYPTAREVRALSTQELDQAKQKAYTDWLKAAQEDTAVVKREVDVSTIIPQKVRDDAAAFRRQFNLDQ